MFQIGYIEPSQISSGNTWIDKYPNECPLCQSGISPTPVECRSILNIEAKSHHPKRLSMVLGCPKDDCKNIFLSYFLPRPHAAHGTVYYFQESKPSNKKERIFSEHIKTVSGEFCETYRQAYTSEQEGLDRVSGPAYGKALELLIKDYLISKDPSKIEIIKAEYKLGKLIAEEVSDERIKSVAKRAAWLRNDEIHYQRKWIDKDVQDLKLTIDLVMHWIEAELLTKKLIEDMPETQTLA